MINLKRILFPTDFSPCAAEAADYACAFVDQFGAELHLLHVFLDLATLPDISMTLEAAGYVTTEELEQQAIAALAKVLNPEWQRTKSVILATKQGSPFVEIVRYAKYHEIDLIVIGTHGRSALAHALLGSVAEKVVRTSPCPVLTVRPRGHNFVMP